MAFTLKIEGNFFVIFNTATPFSEVFRAPKLHTSFFYRQENSIDYFTFKASQGVFVSGSTKYVFDDLIDSTTGSVFASVAALQTFLSTNLAS